MKLKQILLAAILINLTYGKQSLELSLIGNKFDYKEYNNQNQEIDSESSNYNDLYGINGVYTININKSKIGLSIDYLKGSTTYKGSTWGGDSLELNEKNVKLINANLFIDCELFYDTIEDNYGYLYLSTGLGYRYWDRGKSDYSGDYNEKYYWPYYFIGFKLEDTFHNKYSIGIYTTYQKAINPKMHADLGNGITYNLGKTSGYKIEIPVKYYISHNYGIKLSYIINYWKINKSDTQTITLNNQQIKTLEPDSKTKNKFISLGIFYNF